MEFGLEYPQSTWKYDLWKSFYKILSKPDKYDNYRAIINKIIKETIDQKSYIVNFDNYQTRGLITNRGESYGFFYHDDSCELMSDFKILVDIQGNQFSFGFEDDYINGSRIPQVETLLNKFRSWHNGPNTKSAQKI